MMNRAALLFAFLMLGASSLQAGEVQRSLLLSGVPTTGDLARFESLGSPISYRVTLSSPSDSDFERLAQLPNRRELQLRIDGMPTAREFDSIAQFLKKVEVSRLLILLGDRYPTAAEATLLNGLPPARVELVFGRYPSSLEIPRLNQLAGVAGGERWLTFATLRFPYALEQIALLQLDPKLGLEFITDLWPRYYAMDFLNRLKNPKQLIIRGIFPSDSDLEYLAEVRPLLRLVVETDFDPVRPESFWLKLERYPLIWVRQEAFPTAGSLSAFSEMQARSASGDGPKLVLDLGRELTARESQALEGSGATVELRSSAND